MLDQFDEMHAGDMPAWFAPRHRGEIARDAVVKLDSCDDALKLLLSTESHLKAALGSRRLQGLSSSVRESTFGAQVWTSLVKAEAAGRRDKSLTREAIWS